MMLISENDLTMKTKWIRIEKVAETGDLIEEEPVYLNTWIMDNKVLFTQNENGYNKVNAKGYILSKNTTVKIGDKLDGVFVQKVNEINDFDGSIDHIEAFTY